MPRKTGLGRGLDALIPSTEFVPEESGLQPGVTQIDVDDILPNPRQPRSSFPVQEMEELAASIRQHGIIQPLIVTRGLHANQYILVAGERRLIAARQAGLRAVPALVREASDQQRLELALIENVQRADLGPLEAAEAFRQLMDDFRLSHEEIAERVGKSRVTVTNTLRLLKLPEAVKQALVEKRISEGHARALLTLATAQAQVAALHTILSHDLTVRQVEELARKMAGEKPPQKPKPQPAPEISDLQNRLEASLGTRVNLNPRRNGGTITIHYYSNEELDALVERLLNE
jgi:ParB family chromosome partitioning protein